MGVRATSRSPQKNKTIIINIKTTDGKQIDVKIGQNDSVSALKQRVQTITGIPEAEQNYLKAGSREFLEDEKTLAFYRLKSFDFLYLKR